MKEKIRIAMIGCGRFAKFFVPLFKAHPEVEKVWVCDLIDERAQDFSQKFDVEIMESFEKALASDEVNSVAIFTQRFAHGPMVIDALKAGKHVYSAVPGAVSVEEIKEIEKLVRETRLTYSMGETGYYRTATLFCREQYAKGTFGKFAYAEAQYNHDIRNMEESFKSSAGDRWKEYAGIPPFFYPTHSTSMILSAMPGVYVTKVCGMGYKSETRTDIYGADGENLYDNPFANEAMLCQLSNGGVIRVSENRHIGWQSPETYITQFFGTEGGYEFSVAHHYLQTWNPENKNSTLIEDVSERLLPESVTALLKEDYQKGIQHIANSGGFFETSPIQDNKRLPESFRNLENGHNGTHHYLIDDFCKAYATGKLSPTNIWEVAKYNIPGLVAHESAMKGSVLMDVPYLGEPPADWEVIDPYDFDYNQKN